LKKARALVAKADAKEEKEFKTLSAKYGPGASR
jgi:hypothetical protein